MLESLRAIQNTKAGKAILATIMGLIMVSFVIWGIGPVFNGFNANQIATVGGSTVTVDAFRQAYQGESQQLQQRTKRVITNAQAHQYGIDTQVLSRLVSEAVLDNQASALGLSISDPQVAKAIVSDPSFKGANGQFDRGRFNAILRENDTNEQSFVREQRAVYLRQELVQGLVGAVRTPRVALDALHRFQAETRSLDYVVLPASAAGDIQAPDDATLQKFFDDRAPSFRAPEYRKLVVLPLLAATLARPDQVSEADIAKLYDGVKDARYTTPEYRTLQQIAFPNEADAVTAAARIKAGTSFADVAAERKLTDKDIDLGRVTKGGLFDKAVAEAAFGLPADGVSDPVKTAFGATIVRVAAIEPASVKPLADVASELRAEIAASRTGDAIRSLHDKVEDARASGQDLAAAAQAAGLSARTIEAVDATGRDKAGQIVDLPESEALLRAAFASDVGVDNETVRTRDGGQVFYEVASIEAGRAQSLAEVKPKVEAAWRSDETVKRLATKAGDVVKAIDGGQSLEQAAAGLGNLSVQHVADVRRSGGTGLNAATVAQAFSVKVGSAAAAPGDGETRVVFKVLGAVVPPINPDETQTKQFEAQYKSWLSEDMLTAYLTTAEGRIGVRINPDAYLAAIGNNS